MHAKLQGPGNDSKEILQRTLQILLQKLKELSIILLYALLYL